VLIKTQQSWAGNGVLKQEHGNEKFSGELRDLPKGKVVLLSDEELAGGARPTLSLACAGTSDKACADQGMRKNTPVGGFL